jgi:hypothetical protein
MGKFFTPGRLAPVILVCVLTAGCGVSPAYLVATRATQEKNVFFRSFPELTARENILKVAEETGKSLGYTSTGVINTDYFDALGLKVSSDSAAKDMLLPGGTKTQIKITCPRPRALAEFRKNAGRAQIDAEAYQRMTTLCIELEHKGYWGAGGKEEAERVFNRFIDKFLERAGVGPKEKSS